MCSPIRSHSKRGKCRLAESTPLCKGVVWSYLQELGSRSKDMCRCIKGRSSQHILWAVKYSTWINLNRSCATILQSQAQPSRTHGKASRRLLLRNMQFFLARQIKNYLRSIFSSFLSTTMWKTYLGLSLKEN